MDNRSIIVFDLDGTLSLTDHRQHLVRKPENADPDWRPDWPAFFQASADDPPNEPVVGLYRRLRYSREPGEEFWILSGRSEEVSAPTMEWLKAQGIAYDRLYMRPENDFQPDEDLKRFWAVTDAGPSNIRVAFDDRDKVVAMWRSLGVLCCQVAPGDF